MQIDFLVLICGYFNKFVVYIFVTVPLGNSEDLISNLFFAYIVDTDVMKRV